jgi:hypothetical protein
MVDGERLDDLRERLCFVHGRIRRFAATDKCQFGGLREIYRNCSRPFLCPPLPNCAAGRHWDVPAERPALPSLIPSRHHHLLRGLFPLHFQLVVRLSNDLKPKTLVEQARTIVLHNVQRQSFAAKAKWGVFIYFDFREELAAALLRKARWLRRALNYAPKSIKVRE